MTRFAEDGPHHVIYEELFLGSSVPDADSDGQPTLAAGGDDGDAQGDDEDGIVSFPTLVAGQSATIEVMTNNSTGSTATLYGFIDWDGDGDFDLPSEQATAAVATATNGLVNLVFNVPADALIETDLGARFRLSTETELGATGRASDGEVEDYILQVRSPQPFAPLDVNQDGSVDASTDGNLVQVVLFGLPVANLSAFLGSTSLTGEQVQQNVEQLRDDLTLDVNESGTVDASTDGNLIQVVLFGLPVGNLSPFRGDTLLTNEQIQQKVLALTTAPSPPAVAKPGWNAGSFHYRRPEADFRDNRSLTTADTFADRSTSGGVVRPQDPFVQLPGRRGGVYQVADFLVALTQDESSESENNYEHILDDHKHLAPLDDAYRSDEFLDELARISME